MSTIYFQEECSESIFLECDLDSTLMDTFYGVLWLNMEPVQPVLTIFKSADKETCIFCKSEYKKNKTVLRILRTKFRWTLMKISETLM